MLKKQKAPKKGTKTSVSARHIFYYFWCALMRHKIRTLIILLLVPLYTYLGNIVVPQILSQIIGQLSAGDTVFENYHSILLLAAGIILVNNLIFVRLIDWLDWSLDARGSFFLDNLSFEKIIYASHDFHKTRFSGALTSAASKLSSAFIRLKSTITWDLYPLVLTIILSIITIFFISPPFAIILSVFVLAFTTVSVIIYTKTRHYEETWAKTDNKRVGQLSDAISNATSIKSYANESFEKSRYEKVVRANARAITDTAKVSGLRNFVQNLINTSFSLCFIVLLINGPALFGLTVAEIVLLYSLTNTTINRLWSIGSILRNFNHSLSDAKEMVEILNQPTDIIDNKNATTLAINHASVDFQHISFQHSDENSPLFKDFSMSIKAGERVGLVGASGSGKSTLTKLLLRFSDLKSGNIFIDGQDIAEVTQNSLRKNIAYVPQETILFHRSIFENIAYGKPGATKDEVVHAAKLANAHDFIEKLPEGYDTLAGERGSKLSGGQRQRIAIARAILKDAPILVLDEATSALDTESERLIQDALKKLMRNRTSLVIAHRLSTVSNLDRIIVLRDGKIAEQGTHRQLLLKDGLYQKLWSAQGGALLDSEEQDPNNADNSPEN